MPDYVGSDWTAHERLRLVSALERRTALGVLGGRGRHRQLFIATRHQRVEPEAFQRRVDRARTHATDSGTR